MGRELRKVPANWEHPKRSNGAFQPMFKTFYGDAINEWLDNHKKWDDGTHDDLKEHPNRKEEYPFYALWGGNPPDVEYYQTKRYSPEQLTHIQLYESTSEGTPISPVFPESQFEQLCEWAADNATVFADFKVSKEEWMKMLKDDFVYYQQGNIAFF